MISDTLKLPYADSAGRGDQDRVSTRTGTARVRALTAALLLSAALTACETQPVNPVEWQQGFPWSFVDSGYWHTCALAETTAYCWGSNQYGELGVDPSSVPGGSSRPVAVVGGHQFSTIGTGGKHTCGLTVDGEALCWGFDEFGETGGGGPVGAPFQFSDPRPVSGGLTFAALSVGFEHACGITENAEAYCWGLNTFGQLGYDTAIPASSTPQAVQGGLRFSAISAGREHTCGIAEDDTAYCWGNNQTGQLGNSAIPAGYINHQPPPNSRSTAPVPVDGGHTFLKISAGGVNTCGITNDGAVYCWGDDSGGQLGNNRGAAGGFANEPVMVALQPPATDISVGYQFACAIRAPQYLGQYDTYCWGIGHEGQLGQEPPESLCGYLSCVAQPHPVEGTGIGHRIPWAIPAGQATRSVSARGLIRGCRLVVPQGGPYGQILYFDEDHAHLSCWGSNWAGGLGDGTMVDSSDPVRVMSPG